MKFRLSLSIFNRKTVVFLLVLNLCLAFVFFYLRGDFLFGPLKVSLSSPLDPKIKLDESKAFKFIKKYKIDTEGVIDPDMKFETEVKKNKVKRIIIVINSGKAFEGNRLYQGQTLISSSKKVLRGKELTIEISINRDFYNSLSSDQKEIFITQRIVSELILLSNANFSYNQDIILKKMREELGNILKNKIKIVRI